MKICFIANVKSIHTRRWIEPLIGQDFEVYVINYRRGGTRINGSKDFIDLSTWYQPPKIRFLVWGLWVRRYINRIKPHIVHAHQIPAAGWLGSMTGFHPFVLSTWGSDLLVEPTKSIFRRILTNTVLSRVDHLTVPSRLMLDASLDLGFPPSQVHLIPWGVDTNVYKPTGGNKKVLRQQFNLRSDAPFLLSPRRITSVCNIEVIIAALPKVIDSYSDVQLALVRFNPDPIYLQKLEHQIKDLGLENYIVWLPPQNSSERMANLYQMADIVLSLPSSEGYGASVYEALATGTPTIISDLPVFENELIHEKHTLKVQVKNSAQTSDAILRLIDDKNLRERLIKNGLETSLERSAGIRIKRVEALYNQIYQG